jgi:hypothetical protein
MGVTRTNGIPPRPANNNFKVMGNGAAARSFPNPPRAAISDGRSSIASSSAPATRWSCSTSG